APLEMPAPSALLFAFPAFPSWSLRTPDTAISGARCEMRCNRTGRENDIHFGGGIEPLKSAPERFGSGGTVGFAAQMTADLADHSHRAIQSGRFSRRRRSLVHVTMESLPLFIFEEDRAGQFGRFASQHGQMVDAPGDDHVDTETSFQSICCSQLTVFD